MASRRGDLDGATDSNLHRLVAWCRDGRLSIRLGACSGGRVMASATRAVARADAVPINYPRAHAAGR